MAINNSSVSSLFAVGGWVVSVLFSLAWYRVPSSPDKVPFWVAISMGESLVWGRSGVGSTVVLSSAAFAVEAKTELRRSNNVAKNNIFLFFCILSSNHFSLNEYLEPSIGTSNPDSRTRVSNYWNKCYNMLSIFLICLFDYLEALRF